MNTEDRAEGDTSAQDSRLLLPLSEAARRLGYSRSTIVRACDDGDLPVVTFRGMRRVPAAFVDAVIAAATGGTTVAIEQLAAEWKDRTAAQQAGTAAATP
ncbi:MAG TPA: helix-turn-helix domain-containing protein [Streptosporangiaceae bacterium]|nr:helix-turn-helix domain-containing protein [Streptosporangiaceae bacterium]